MNTAADQPEVAPLVQTPQLAQLNSQKWLNQVKNAYKNQEKWLTQADRIVKRFLDKRDSSQEASNKINLFTSNTQILISTLYARFPKPLVTREFDDPNDDVARVGGEIIERCLRIKPRDDFDSAMRYVVQDRLVPGLGTVWMRYESDIEQKQTEAVMDETGTVELVPASQYEEITDERVCTDYVYYRDLSWSPARVWEDVRWITRRCRMTKQDVTKRFGKKIADQLTYSKSDSTNQTAAKDTNRPDHDDTRYADVYECWDKPTKKVYWFCEGFDYFLDMRDDPLGLDGFFPTPRFLMALTSTGNLMPRPDYLLAQDQYEELDLVNNRITWLERAIKVIGIYDGNNEEITRLLEEGVENKIIPTRSFNEFAEKGGFKGAIDWFPLDQLVSAMDKLQSYRQVLVSQIYELTGISDIMRGATKASETAAAQQLKAQYGSVKLQFLQMEVAAFVEETLKIKAQIITKIFQPETIIRIANVAYMYDQELIQQAVQLIKSPDWDYRIEVHADSMAVPEFSAERDDRMGFMRAIAEMMTAAAPVIQQDPAAGAAMLEVVKWGAASFRSGRSIEGVLDKAIQSIQKAAAQPKQPPAPDPTKIAAAKKDESQANLNTAKANKENLETQILAATGYQPGTPPTTSPASAG
jgi:hypothetical protein